MKLVDCQMIKSKYFCLEKVVVKIIKMSVKTTENCVESLMAKGINAASIVVLTPTVTLDTVYLQSPRIDCACQVDTLSSSSENWFERFLEGMDVTEAELDAILTESEEDNLLPDPIDCIVQATNSIRFDWPQCPILRLQNQLQAKCLKITSCVVSEWLSNFFNKCMTIGEFPDSWKIAHITPIPKVHSPSSSSEYRPISVLPVLSNYLKKFFITEYILI